MDMYTKKGKREKSQVAAREILIIFTEKKHSNFIIKMSKHWNKLPRLVVEITV